MKNFKQLKIWEKGVEIVEKVYELTNSIPQREKYGMISQITRAAISISSNIAEGSSRKSDKDYARFLEIALGSTFEVETQLIILQRLKMCELKNIQKIFELIDEEQKMLIAFINKLSS